MGLTRGTVAISRELKSSEMVSVEGEETYTGLTHVGSTQQKDRPGTKNMRDEQSMVLFVWMSPNQFSEK